MEVISVILMFVFGNMNDQSSQMTQYIPMESLSKCMKEVRLLKKKNTEFRIKWPRGELGSLPADAQQDLLIEFMSSQLESMMEDMESMMSNSVNIKRAQQDIERLLNDVEKLKDKIRESNGGH